MNKNILTTQITLALFLLVACGSPKAQNGSSGAESKEPHRLQLHFTPKAKWMNDPNGMVYYKGTYHLFYQHYPDSTVWGPMHWGHATSKDLVHWQHQPIALYPDSLGYIFSGSAVVDANNTSGFGKDGKVPLVAIFTHHDPKGQKARTNTYQTQSLAYSLDEGKTWVKYAGNPVVKNPGVRDFRDPKVTWFEEGKKWIMTLATQDRVTFYSSPNLKEWSKESEFGKELGAHGGVWECPDLFPLEYGGKQVWVLLVSLNPGGPNGGSATQYFVGDFNGKNFTPFQTDTRWIDYGPDDYAGVTWSNTGKRKVFLGWMSNWQYANKVPTENWRSAMTIARDLKLEKLGDRYFLTSLPVPELSRIAEKQIDLKSTGSAPVDLTTKVGKITGPCRLVLSADKAESFTLTFSNGHGEKLLVGFDKEANQYFIDRTASGKSSFDPGFAKKLVAPRISDKPSMEVVLLLDNASVELFGDNGLSVMTGVFFPNEDYSQLSLQGIDVFKRASFSKLQKIW